MSKKRKTRQEKIRAQARGPTTSLRDRQEKSAADAPRSFFKRDPQETGKQYVDRLSTWLCLRIAMFFVPLAIINCLLTWKEPRLRFAGMIVDQYGKAVPGAIVTWDTESRRIIFPFDPDGQTTTDGDGWFWIESRSLTAHSLKLLSI